MPLQIRRLGPADKVVDLVTRITPAIAAGFVRAGVTAVLRYGASIDSAEFSTIMSYRLSLGLLTYGRRSDFSAVTGTVDAQELLDKAKALGIPPGLTYGVDLEDPKGASVNDVLVYERGFAVRVTTIPRNLSGAYIGSGLLMNSADLTGMGSTRYYKSGSRIVDARGNAAEPERGWTLIQRLPFDQTLAGTKVDYDSAGEDFHGDAWTVVCATPSTATLTMPDPDEATRQTLPPPPALDTDPPPAA